MTIRPNPPRLSYQPDAERVRVPLIRSAPQAFLVGLALGSLLASCAWCWLTWNR